MRSDVDSGTGIRNYVNELIRPIKEVTITRGGDSHTHDAALVEWVSGEVVSFWSFWLRIISTDDKRFCDISSGWTDGANFHPQSDIKENLKGIRSIDICDQGASIEVCWADGLRAQISSDTLYHAVYLQDPVAQVHPRPWTSSKHFMRWGWSDIVNHRNPQSTMDMLKEFLMTGIVVITDVPAQEDSVSIFAEAIGTVDRSHLGDTFKVEVADTPKHIGEVNAKIPLHMDLVYRQATPEVQLLHALKQVPSGGENEFVDVLNIIDSLSEKDVRALSEVHVEFVAESTSVHFRGKHPILQFCPDGRFEAVHYNQYKIRFPHWVTPDYFDAFTRFKAMISSAKKAVLIPEGNLVMFDNRRILHGRRNFSNPRRKIIGCFVKGDDIRSTYRQLSTESARRS